MGLTVQAGAGNRNRARVAAHCRALSAGAALLILVAPLAPALAQDATSTTSQDGTTQLDPITVTGTQGGGPVGPDASIVATQSATASKTDAPIIDVPAAVSVVTEEELETRGVESLQDALAYTSGVLVDEFGSDDRYDYYRIRGFAQTVLGTYRDGLPARIPAWFTASRLEPYGLQRVEILKGSTSTLFGLNGPGGLVNSVTKRPQDEFHAEVYTTFGEEHLEVGTDFGGAIDPEGVWSYRFTGLWQDGDHGSDYSNDDRVYIAPALTISPDDGTSLTILTDYSKRDGNGARGFPTGLDIDPDTFLGEPEYNKFDTEQTDIGYLFEHDFDNGLTFRQTARYSHLNLDYEEVYGASTDPTADRTSFATYGTSDRFAIDNQLQYDSSWQTMDSKLLVGADFAYDDTHEDIRYGTAGPIDINDPVYCGRACVVDTPYVDWVVKQKAVGIYAQEQLTIDERWIVTLGGRYDYVDNTADYLLTGTSDHTTADAFTKRAGLTYKINPQLAAYANYSESFQPLVAPTGNGYTVEGSLKPQEGIQYEIGMKYQPEGFDGLFTVALFDLSQTNVPTYISPAVQRQIGEVNVRGVELEGKMALNDRWNLTLAYSYWDAEIVEDGISGNKGNRPDRVPEHIASAWLDYTFPGDGFRGDLTLGGGIRFVGSTYGDAANTVPVDSYTVVDASAKYAVTENVSLAVNVSNLFDKKYETTSYYGTSYYGDRRKIVGTLKYTW
ncbi:TonB-dependent siderophore receptor [Agrobacterium sp. a22-2]|uniref:TonB-dependent siderophore receptor n=1 Tax=Agrobacterium sp. a22-2 TaxID=2283840 RepID=UPI0014455ED9|nr:TonB-dependent siderophore receptor [Agrobacterium sp. a22-2]NKN35607.1 TonB-dependent siderophore receptor [Agrobacterium sp. a22-2]